MKIKKVALLCSIPFLAFAFAGCGKKKASTTKSNQTTSKTTTSNQTSKATTTTQAQSKKMSESDWKKAFGEYLKNVKVDSEQTYAYENDNGLNYETTKIKEAITIDGNKKYYVSSYNNYYTYDFNKAYNAFKKDNSSFDDKNKDLFISFLTDEYYNLYSNDGCEKIADNLYTIPSFSYSYESYVEAKEDYSIVYSSGYGSPNWSFQIMAGSQAYSYIDYVSEALADLYKDAKIDEKTLEYTIPFSLLDKKVASIFDEELVGGEGNVIVKFDSSNKISELLIEMIADGEIEKDTFKFSEYGSQKVTIPNNCSPVDFSGSKYLAGYDSNCEVQINGMSYYSNKHNFVNHVCDICGAKERALGKITDFYPSVDDVLDDIFEIKYNIVDKTICAFEPSNKYNFEYEGYSYVPALDDHLAKYTCSDVPYYYYYGYDYDYSSDCGYDYLHTYIIFNEHDVEVLRITAVNSYINHTLDDGTKGEKIDECSYYVTYKCKNCDASVKVIAYEHDYESKTNDKDSSCSHCDVNTCKHCGQQFVDYVNNHNYELTDISGDKATIYCKNGGCTFTAPCTLKVIYCGTDDHRFEISFVDEFGNNQTITKEYYHEVTNDGVCEICGYVLNNYYNYIELGNTNDVYYVKYDGGKIVDVGCDTILPTPTYTYYDNGKAKTITYGSISSATDSYGYQYIFTYTDIDDCNMICNATVNFYFEGEIEKTVNFDYRNGSKIDNHDTDALDVLGEYNFDGGVISLIKCNDCGKVFFRYYK